MVVTNENIEEYLAKQEDASLEFKYGTIVPDVIGRTICGFANSSGGILIVGYSEKSGKIFGNSHNDENKIKRVMGSFENPPAYELYYVGYQGKQLLIVEVQQNKDSLTLYNGIAYSRKKDVNFALSGAELKQRLSTTSDKNREELLSQMHDNLIELNKKLAQYEAGLAKSNTNALIYCFVGIFGGAILSNIQSIIDFIKYLLSK